MKTAHRRTAGAGKLALARLPGTREARGSSSWGPGMSYWGVCVFSGHQQRQQTAGRRLFRILQKASAPPRSIKRLRRSNIGLSDINVKGRCTKGVGHTECKGLQVACKSERMKVATVHMFLRKTTRLFLALEGFASNTSKQKYIFQFE